MAYARCLPGPHTGTVAGCDHSAGRVLPFQAHSHAARTVVICILNRVTCEPLLLVSCYLVNTNGIETTWGKWVTQCVNATRIFGTFAMINYKNLLIRLIMCVHQFKCNNLTTAKFIFMIFDNGKLCWYLSTHSSFGWSQTTIKRCFTWRKTYVQISRVTRQYLLKWIMFWIQVGEKNEIHILCSVHFSTISFRVLWIMKQKDLCCDISWLEKCWTHFNKFMRWRFLLLSYFSFTLFVRQHKN
jgi:hypothetical protein